MSYREWPHCKACDKPLGVERNDFLCGSCMGRLSDGLRHNLATTPRDQSKGLREMALRELAVPFNAYSQKARKSMLQGADVQPDKWDLRKPPAPRQQTHRPDCGHKSYRFSQANLLGGDDEVCDECGHVRRKVTA